MKKPPEKPPGEGWELWKMGERFVWIFPEDDLYMEGYLEVMRKINERKNEKGNAKEPPKEPP